MQDIDVMITLEEGTDVDAVVDALRAVGVEVKDVLGEVGVVTARCHTEIPDKLEQIPGIARVERQRSIKIPPPGSSVQ